MDVGNVCGVGIQSAKMAIKTSKEHLIELYLSSDGDPKSTFIEDQYGRKLGNVTSCCWEMGMAGSFSKMTLELQLVKLKSSLSTKDQIKELEEDIATLKTQLKDMEKLLSEKLLESV